MSILVLVLVVVFTSIFSTCTHVHTYRHRESEVRGVLGGLSRVRSPWKEETSNRGQWLPLANMQQALSTEFKDMLSPTVSGGVVGSNLRGSN